MFGLLVLVQAVLRLADNHVCQTQTAADEHLLGSLNHSTQLHRNRNEAGSSADTRRVDWQSVREIMTAQFLLGGAMLLYRADFAVTVSERYGTSNTTNGYITSLSSTMGTMAGFAVGHIADTYSGNTHRLFLHTAVMQSVCLLVTISAPTLMLFTAGHVALAFVTAVGRVASMQTLLVHGCQQHTGTLIGTSASVLSVARMLAPTASGVSQELLSYHGPALLSAVLSLAGTIVLLVIPSKTGRKAHAD